MASTTQDQSMLIGRFQLETLVGGSEHSQVWRARDVELERTVAIKLTRLPNEDARGRFKQEALLLARLAHPNLLQLYSFGEVGDGRAYMALEWIDNGRSLADVMTERARFAWREVAQLGRAVASALACAHEHGVLHRDIKPSNILLPPGGLDHAKLSDFGVLGALDETDARLGQTTQIGVVAGTPMYMAPEQFSGQRLSSRTDLYSLAVVMRNMLWPADPRSLSLTSILLERLQHSGQIPDDRAVPRQLRDLLRAMLQREPEARPSSAATIATALNTLLGESTLAPVPVMPAPVASPAQGTARETGPTVTPAPAYYDALPTPSARVDSPTLGRKSSHTLIIATLGVLLTIAVGALMFMVVSTPPGLPSPSAVPSPSVVPSRSGASPTTVPPQPTPTAVVAKSSQPSSRIELATARLSLFALAQGVALMLAGALAGLLISHAIEVRRTALERNVSLALTGSKDRSNLSRTMMVTVDAIIQQTSKLDARFLGATIIGMVREYDDAKESSDKQQALVRATELLEKLLEKTSPWYVRNSKCVVAAASLVGLVSGASKMVSELGALFH